MIDENKILAEVGAEVGKETVRRAFKFLEVLLLPPLQEAGLLAQDRVKLWRFKNQINILNKAQDLLEKKNISPGKVPLKFLLPLLEMRNPFYLDTESDSNWTPKSWYFLLPFRV